jgi:hypothetical protein
LGLITDLMLESDGTLGVELGITVVVITTTVVETITALDVVLETTGIELDTPVDSGTFEAGVVPLEKGVYDEGDALLEALVYGYGG